VPTFSQSYTSVNKKYNLSIQMKKHLTILLVIFMGLTNLVNAQERSLIPLPKTFKKSYPRIYITDDKKFELESTIEKEKWAQDVLSGIRDRIDKYVEIHVSDPEWMPSRLQMYWKSRSANVYIKGPIYSHADGKAPFPTVRFTGARDYTTDFTLPNLEDVVPYMEDERGLYLPNKTKEGMPFEWVEISKTGGIIHKLNAKIMAHARDAAFISWLQNDKRYAKFAFDIFDTYMRGMHHRNEPIDISNSHIGTIVGLSCFQVMSEKILITISELYDFLHTYIEHNYPKRIGEYDITIKRWIDQIIKNGVPHNNWNLHEARIILKAATVLQTDDKYDDGKGCEHYINQILNISTVRQWSLTKLMDYGYDENNGVWGESPGYSQTVTKDFMSFIRDFDNVMNHNILPYTPIMDKAVNMLPQYLFPNGKIVGFGDTYYCPLNTKPIADMIHIAKKNGDKKREKKFTSMYRLFETKKNNKSTINSKKPQINSFFTDKPFKLNETYQKGELKDYITQTFYAPNVSWHVQRIGDGKHGLMASLNGSLGNHMHANGINMELYGKGLIQGADPGKGADYLQPLYLKYYSQFPAHNTVMVDGVSSYTEMMSHHAFELQSEYPKSEQRDGYYPGITYSDVYFLEPETQSDQNRTVSIVKTGETSGYYVDIFRSKKKKGNDKFHDYYYHNLGQTMQIKGEKGQLLDLSPNNELTFAGGHLNALDYMWDKNSIQTNKNYMVDWKIDFPEDQEDVNMSLWMKGTEGREIFSIKSPPCKSFKDAKGIPYDVKNAPYLTFMARQHSEAWDHPFISVYEPYMSKTGKCIQSVNSFEDENGNKDFAGLHIVHKSGREDYILASYGGKVSKYENIESDATYSVFVKEQDGNYTLFMGNGTCVKMNKLCVKAKSKGNVVLKKEGETYYLHNEVPVVLKMNRRKIKFGVGKMRKIEL